LPVPAAERTTWTPSPERVKRHDEIALVAAQAPAGVESGSDGFRLGDGDGRRPAAFGTVQQLALGHEQRTRRALGLEASALQRNDLVPVEEGGCAPFDHGHARAARRRLRERLHDIPAGEPRAVTRQAVGTLEPPRQVLDDRELVE